MPNDKTPSEATNALVRGKSQRLLEKQPGSPAKEKQQTSNKVVKSPAKETTKQHPAKGAMEVLPSEDDVEDMPPIEDTLRQGAEKRLPPQEDTVTKDVTGDGTKDPTTNSKSSKGAV